MLYFIEVLILTIIGFMSLSVVILLIKQIISSFKEKIYTEEESFIIQVNTMDLHESHLAAHRAITFRLEESFAMLEAQNKRILHLEELISGVQSTVRGPRNIPEETNLSLTVEFLEAHNKRILFLEDVISRFPDINGITISEEKAEAMSQPDGYCLKGYEDN